MRVPRLRRSDRAVLALAGLLVLGAWSIEAAPHLRVSPQLAVGATCTLAVAVSVAGRAVTRALANEDAAARIESTAASGAGPLAPGASPGASDASPLTLVHEARDA